MTKEQEEAIETMRHWIDFEKHNRDKINKADDLIKIQETVLNILKQNSAELAEKNAEIEKKDKQIDLMAYNLADYVMYYEYDRCRNPVMIKHKAEELKKYYEGKANDGRN